jgi:type I restriction-modification system DNA methylase subunit
MREISAVFAEYVQSPNEAQTEDGLIKPILKALGHTFEIQVALHTPYGVKKPDYLFYRDQASLNSNKGQVVNNHLPQQGAFAVGDAKYWDRPLDKVWSDKEQGRETKATQSALSNSNPGFQIDFYIRHSGLDWGILTNGRLWRLYHKDTSQQLTRYYEVDLPHLLSLNDPELFLYFYAFFSRAAFEDQPLGVAAIRKESTDYAQGVGNSLRTQVFEALRHLSQGFLDYPQNNLQHDAATLKQIYDASLILLYRLLFVLYAESRGLLPVRENAVYRDSYSFDALKKQIERDLRMGKRLLSTTSKLWPTIKELFGIIDKGIDSKNPPLKVTSYNGGLFDPQKHPFLDKYVVGDAHLQQAVDMLTRVNGQFVDYRDLSERHLGTIYEGLLEYQLAPIEPEAEWSVALVNEKGERKVTGSYYTPDFVVKYIVDTTLRPLLDSLTAGAESDDEKMEAVLSANILDPAMGSGHFLVEATEYIARYLVGLGLRPQGATDDPDSDLAAWKRRVVQSCIYGVDLNPLAVELAKLSLWLSTVAKDRPLSFLDHHLRVGNALVGASVEELGLIEQVQAPARKKAGKKAKVSAGDTTQLSMFGDEAFLQAMSDAVEGMWSIEENPGLDVQQVKRQEREYYELRERLNNKYGALADLVTAQHFGLSIDLDPGQWKALRDFATGRVVGAVSQFHGWLSVARETSRELRFFHWPLEFPEVYFDRQGQLKEDRGFDAVVGNPPYIRQEQLGPVKSYLETTYTDVYAGTADIFVYFIRQGMRQLRERGRLSYISSNSWLRANYATPLRAYLRTRTTVETVVDLGDNRVFADAPDVYPSIVRIRQEAPPADYAAETAIFTRGEGLASFDSKVQQKLRLVSIHDQQDTGWQLGADMDRRVFQKLMSKGRPLGEVIEGQMYRGVLTGLNEAFIIDTSTRDSLVKTDPDSADVIKPLINGEDVRPWFVESEGRWLILLPDKWTINTFGPGLTEDEAWAQLEMRHPSIAQHLSSHAELARKRSDKGDYWWELRPCTYYSDFDGYKVFWPEMAKQPRFALAEPGIVGNKTTFMIPGERPFLLGLLMSRTLWFAITKLCVPIGERKGMLRYTLSGQFMARLPIMEATDIQQRAIAQLAKEATQQARDRYKLHRQTRRRLQTDLGTPGKSLNQKLTTWWQLDFAGLRTELQKVFKREVPVKERDEWEEWFAGRVAEHMKLTAEIVRVERQLNDLVYSLYALTPAERQIIEDSTKYEYGEV